MLEFSDEMVNDAGQGFRRIEGFITRAMEALKVSSIDVDPSARAQAFDVAMDDDINTPQALAAIHGTVRDGNAALAAGDLDATRSAVTSVVAMLDVLGLNPAQWQSAGSDEQLTDAVDGLVKVALDQRQAARERKDYAASDAIRDQLTDMGIAIEDTPEGPRWSLTGRASETTETNDDGR